MHSCVSLLSGQAATRYTSQTKLPAASAQADELLLIYLQNPCKNRPAKILTDIRPSHTRANAGHNNAAHLLSRTYSSARPYSHAFACSFPTVRRCTDPGLRHSTARTRRFDTSTKSPAPHSMRHSSFTRSKTIFMD